MVPGAPGAPGHGGRLALAAVVPTRNESAALPVLLERLLGTELDADDRADLVVVADGASTDGTSALAAARGALVVAAAPGRGTQLAAGARAVPAEVVGGDGLLFFVHADCCPAPGALAALRGAFADPELEAAGCRQRIEAAGRFYRLVERAADRRVRRGMVYGDSGLCVRRAVYQALGGFAELPLFEDVELCERLAGRRLRLVEGAVLAISARRWEREGKLRATLRNWGLRLAYAAGAPPRRLVRRYRPEHG